ncbi:hypothetical protein JRO89_XSUnG0060200 [Xanthoceras sorbifolium]|uniref:Uncharacterized protein n=1 Tax=Xanthoceras sorbifolium TaxID=99658 RepID=A0ABQ8GZS0_9ROSI|nr:hypothetical protein JRO89_XSUnG0060200 [Xanthoceras sorbifolium]
MAIVFEEFSIREYAAKMRSVDVVKCWPFSGESDEINKKDIETLLPPITVTKFRWWSHELDLLRSNPSPTNDDDVNPHIDDSCLSSQAGRKHMRLAIKSKSKAPKKRSIAEIFASARQIDHFDAAQEHQLNSTNVDFHFKIQKKNNNNKKKKTVNKLMNSNRKLKNKSLKNVLISNKENTIKLKLQTPVKFSKRLSESSCSMGSPKDMLDSVTVNGKKQELKCLSTQKKQKVVQTSRSITKHQEPLIPICGILRNCSKDVSGQNARSCSLQGQVNACGIQHSDRRVRFSGKDDILGPRKKYVSTFEKDIGKLYSDAFPSSLENDQLAENNKELVAMEVNRMNHDVVSISGDTETPMLPMSEKHLLPDGHNTMDIPSFLRPCTTQEKLKHLSEKSDYPSQVASSNDTLHMFDRGDRITSHRDPYAGMPELLSALNEVRKPYVNTQVHGSVSRASSSSAKFMDCFENHSLGEAAMSSLENMRGYLQPSSSAAENVTGHALQYQPFSHLSPIELTSSLYPFPEWKQTAVSFRQNCMNEGFLACLSIRKLTWTKSWPSKKYGKLFKHERMSFCWLGVAEMPAPAREDVQWLDLMLLNTTQLTMRLMGKDVAIGRSSKDVQDYPDGKDNWHQVSGISDQPLNQQRDILIKAPDSRFLHPHVNWKTNTVFQNGSLPISRGPVPKLHHIAYTPTFPASFNSAANFQEAFMPGPETLRVSSQLPVLSTPHINCEHMNLNPSELKYKQNLPQATNSAFTFPFLYPDCSEQTQPSWFQSSSKSLLPWLLHATQVKTPTACSQPFAEMSRKHHCHTSAKNLLASTSVHHSSVAYPCNPVTPHVHMESSLGPASAFHPSFVPAFSGIKTTSSIDMSYRNRNKRTRKRPVAKEDYPTRATKMPNLGIQEDLSAVMELTRGDYSRNIQCNAGASELNSNKDRASSPGCGCLGVPEDVRATKGMASGSFSNDELTSNNVEEGGPEKSKSVGAIRTSSTIDSSKVDGMSRAGGPVKLSAGAKHILKPSQNMNQDNSRPIHSTIPIATVTETNSLLESQKKSTKFYRMSLPSPAKYFIYVRSRLRFLNSRGRS